MNGITMIAIIWQNFFAGPFFGIGIPELILLLIPPVIIIIVIVLIVRYILRKKK